MDIDKNDYTTDNLISVLVEITTFCNMECPHCIRTIKDVKNKWYNKHMNLNDFQHIVDSLPPADEIVTQGIGEPTMHPHLPEIIKIAAKSKKFTNITLTTNAMSRKADYYQRLFQAGLTRLYISVDSLEQELANQLRTGTSVAKLKDIIQILSKQFPEEIAIRTTVGRNNINTIPTLLKDLNMLGSLDIFMHPYDDIGNPMGSLGQEESELFQNEIPIIAASFKNLQVKANSFIPSPKVCIHPWRIPAITVDGYLVPCCRTMDKDIVNFGNVISNSFVDIWQSENINQMRNDFLFQTPTFCTGCPRYAAQGNIGKQL